MKQITSPENALVKKALKLKKPKNREQLKRCLVEGLRACSTFLESEYVLSRMFITKEHSEWALKTIPEEKIVLVSQQIMQKISTAVTPCGIIGMFDLPQPRKLQELTDGIVLVEIQDPGNMGTLIRTATALNKSIVIVDGANPYNQKVIQSSAGAIAHSKLFRCSWDELYSHKHDMHLCALVVQNGTPITTIDKTSPRLLVVGNEAQGLPEEIVQQCDETLTLPMPGETESLNAAVAGSIALYMVSLP